MTDTSVIQETTAPETPARKPVRRRRAAKPARRKVAAAPQPAARQLSEFAGITPVECPLDCEQERCCITGVSVCGHPHKGGLQAAFLGKPEVVARYNRARKELAQQKLDRQ